MKAQWRKRPLPKRHQKAPGRIRADLAALPSSELASAANRLSTGEIGPYLGTSTFANSAKLGEFETILAGLPSKTLQGLATTHRWIRHAGALYRYHSDRNTAILYLRKSNSHGRIINAPGLLRRARSAKAIMARLDQAARAFGQLKLTPHDLRTPGHAASRLLQLHTRAALPIRPGHRSQFLQSFRGARFESTTFGRIPHLYDYDINSAYPHYVAGLVSVDSVVFYNRPDLTLAQDAEYAAALVDIEVNDTLPRGPIAYRVNESSLFWPVGKLSQVWINAPEVKLLLDHPDLGRITQVHAASWGLARHKTRPYAALMEKLVGLRQTSPEFADFTKRIAVSVWGKFQSHYPDGSRWVAPKWFNPVYSSHVTAQMRVDNFRRTMGSHVYGEFVDGYAVDTPQTANSTGGGVVQGGKWGGIRLEGAGSMLIVTDLLKQASWKTVFADLETLMTESPTMRGVPLHHEYKTTLAEVAQRRDLPRRIGDSASLDMVIPLGSAVRPMILGGFQNRDFLADQFQSRPPKENELPSMLLTSGMVNPLRKVLTTDGIFPG